VLDPSLIVKSFVVSPMLGRNAVIGHSPVADFPWIGVVTSARMQVADFPRIQVARLHTESRPTE
jgi:hypothetical protein